MESKTLVSVANDLRKQHNAIQDIVGTRTAELAAYQDELSRIEAALAALTGDLPKPVANATKSKTTKRSAQTPSAKKADVIAAMRRILEVQDVLEVVALKSQVETQLTEEGFNRFGFAMRWNEACRDPQFMHTADGLTLRGESDMPAANAPAGVTSKSDQSEATPERRNVQ